MLLFKPVARQTLDGWYLSVGQELRRGDFVEIRTEIYSAEVKNISEARIWFKSKIAEFLHEKEEALTSLWYWMLPSELR